MEVTKKMSIREVLLINPGTARIFMEFGMHSTPPPKAWRTPAPCTAPTPTNWWIS